MVVGKPAYSRGMISICEKYLKSAWGPSKRKERLVHLLEGPCRYHSGGHAN
jgi:hypothetical protein